MYHDLPGPTGLSPHRILFLRDPVSRTLPWLNHGKVARDANATTAEADETAAKVCKALRDKHDKRAKYFKQGKVQKYALQDTVWVEQHHKDVLSKHRQASWYVPGVIVRKVGQDVYAVRVGDNKRRGAPRDGEAQCAGCDRLRRVYVGRRIQIARYARA